VNKGVFIIVFFLSPRQKCSPLFQGRTLHSLGGFPSPTKTPLRSFVGPHQYLSPWGTQQLGLPKKKIEGKGGKTPGKFSKNFLPLLYPGAQKKGGLKENPNSR